MPEGKVSLPRGFPHRFAFVPGWAGVFKVPRFITRVDIDEPGKAGTHGWQVRYRRKGSKFFSDIAGRQRRSPRQSLLEAKDYLASIYAGPPNRCLTEPTRRKKNPIQEAGLRLVYRRRRSKGFFEVYVEAVPPSKSESPRRVYVGTWNGDAVDPRGTASEDRLQEALARARKLRSEMVKAHYAAKPIHVR